MVGKLRCLYVQKHGPHLGDTAFGLMFKLTVRVSFLLGVYRDNGLSSLIVGTIEVVMWLKGLLTYLLSPPDPPSSHREDVVPCFSQKS